MAENKTVANDGDVEAFIESIEDENKRNDARSIMKMMEEITGENPTMWGTSIVGFGSYHYVYASGRKGDFMMTGFSPRKRNTSIYVMPGFSEYGDLLSKLGRHKLGRSCLYVTKLSDVDEGVLRTIVERGYQDMKEKYPGD